MPPNGRCRESSIMQGVDYAAKWSRLLDYAAKWSRVVQQQVGQRDQQQHEPRRVHNYLILWRLRADTNWYQNPSWT
jgi:hypothetical protein